MAAVPAPADFQALRDYLTEQQIDIDHLLFHLGHFLTKTEHLPVGDWFSDPQEEHQAWAYRQTIAEFIDMVQTGPEEGNGESPLESR